VSNASLSREVMPLKINIFIPSKVSSLSLSQICGHEGGHRTHRDIRHAVVPRKGRKCRPHRGDQTGDSPAKDARVRQGWHRSRTLRPRQRWAEARERRPSAAARPRRSALGQHTVHSSPCRSLRSNTVAMRQGRTSAQGHYEETGVGIMLAEEWPRGNNGTLQNANLSCRTQPP
jgi:hypothetical protein